MKTAHEYAKAIWHDMTSRSGMDFDIDDETKAEIWSAWEAIFADAMAEARAETKSQTPNRSTTCQWFEEGETEDGMPYRGPTCRAPATHTACSPISNSVVCEEHKCRCSKLLDREDL